MRRSSALVIAVSLLVVLALAVGCGGSTEIVGKYVKNSGATVELKKDGTFTAHWGGESAPGTEGTYKVKGDVLTLNYRTGVVEKWSIEDGEIKGQIGTLVKK